MLVQHHIKYKEIHGIDEIILMEKGKHRALHCRLRKEGKCKIPVDELAKISRKARMRTEASKNAYHKYDSTRKFYDKKARRQITFYETLFLNVRLSENIRYNLFTGCIEIYTYFRVGNGKKLCYINI